MKREKRVISQIVAGLTEECVQQRVILLVDTAKAGAWSLERVAVTRCPAVRRRRSQGKPRSWNRRQPVRLRLRRRILRLRNQGKPPGQAEHRAALQVPTVTEQF